MGKLRQVLLDIKRVSASIWARHIALSPDTPLPRIIVGVDIAGSTWKNNSARLHLRKKMYHLLDTALERSGITKEYRDVLDRGDGALILVRRVDAVPTTRLLHTFMPELSRLLAEHNRSSARDHQFRLRAALHTGDVHKDENGFSGEAIDATCRLLDAPALKTRLTQTTTPLTLVISDYIYRTIVRQGYKGIDKETYLPLGQVPVGGDEIQGWVHEPAPTAAMPSSDGEHPQPGIPMPNDGSPRGRLPNQTPPSWFLLLSLIAGS
jgi:hypothetical protein